MPKAIVIGSGIVGLATARSLAVRGYQVTVIERNSRAIGASVRNFGMVWPVGQPDGALYERAMRSRSIWIETCQQAGIWHDPVGSLHLAYSSTEWQVLEELQQVYAHRGTRLLSPAEVKEQSPFARPEELCGGWFSPTETIVDPRQAISLIPGWLTEKYGVDFIWDKAITDIAYPAVYAGKEMWEADKVFVCSGADFETLYPELFREAPITKCKLQMMRLGEQPNGQRIGPALCGGLSLANYTSFRVAPSLQELIKVFEQNYPEHLRWGIHVMVSQNQSGQLTVGDSHEYGATHDPFDRQAINQLILDYLNGFAHFPNAQVVETWNGIYPKLTNGATEWVQHPESGVTIINGVGGAGMTLSFGLAEEVVGGVGYR